MGCDLPPPAARRHPRHQDHHGLAVLALLGPGDELVAPAHDLADAPVHPPYTRAVRILMLTGQRVEEIARLHIDQWDAAERIIDWSKTKNGKPHAIRVPTLAAELI